MQRSRRTAADVYNVIATALKIHLRVVSERMYRYVVLLGYSCEVRRVYNEQ